MKVLVSGATGHTGKRIVSELLDAGHSPVALVRESSDTSELPEGCETRLGDLTDLPADACSGMDAVIFAAGSGSGTGPEMTDKVDRDGAMALVDRALRWKELGEDNLGAPAQDEEFVLYHADNIQATGFLEHIKLPHYVDFQSELELIRKLRREAQASEQAAGQAEGEGPSGGSLKGKMKEGVAS